MSEKRDLIERYLKTLIAKRYPTSDEKTAKLAESVAYSLLSGGKRIRPAMTLMICEIYKPIDEEAIALATTTELIHTASLMLDDLPSMDNAKYRRGRPTNHIVFGEATTILAAMALWSEAVRILSTIRQVEINDIVRETAETVGQKGLVRGQFLDLHSGESSLTVKELEELSYLKTGVLFKNAAKIGAILGRASESDVAMLEKFGKEFGLAYQIRDDILDVESTEKESGKDVMADAKNGRSTFATVLGVTGAKRLLNDKIGCVSRILDDISRDTSSLDGLVSYLK